MLLKIKKDLSAMPLVLETKSGVQHHQDPTQPSNEIIIEQQWGPYALTVDKFDDYIALNFWTLSDGYRTYKVGDFKNYTGRFSRVGMTADSVLQLRIYSNKKTALCAELTTEEGSTCYVLNKVQLTNRWNWHRINHVDQFNNEIIVHNDEEIKANAKIMTKAEATALINYTWAGIISDVTHAQRIYYRNTSAAAYNKLNLETREMLKEFFGDKWPKNSCDEPISPKALIRFSYFKEKNTQVSRQKKTDLFTSVLSKFSVEIENAEPRSQIWFRDENYIG